MSKSVHPLVSIAAIVVVLALAVVGVYKAVAPPQYGPQVNGGRPYGDHMPPAGSPSYGNAPPAKQ